MKPSACLLIFFLSLSAAAVFAQNQNSATKNLYALFDTEWLASLEDNPTFASYLGDKRYNKRWDDRSLEAIKRRNERSVQTLSKLKQIKRAELSASDRLNFDLFQKDLETSVEQFQFRLYLAPVTQRGGIQTADDLANFISFDSVKDYEDWIARLDAFPQFMEQTLSLMREGKAQKILWSKQVLNRVPAQIDKQIVDAPEKSLFYAPFKQMSKNVSAVEQARLQAAAKRAIGEKVIPSYQKLKTYFVAEYFPASYEKAGIWQMPNGDKIYESPVNRYVVIRNISVRNWRTGIHIDGASRVLIDDCRLEHNVNYGIEVNEAARVVVTNSAVTGTGFRLNPATGDFPTTSAPNPGHGISFEDTSSGIVSFTTISGSFGAGINKTSTGMVQTFSNTIFDNGLPSFQTAP